MTSIILTGPAKAGKSTIAKLLSEQTGLPIRSTNQINLADFAYLGYDESHGNQIATEQGEKAVHLYMTQFYPKMIKQFLAQPGEAIIEVGSEFVGYEDPTLVAELQTILQPFPQVVLLMPSPELEQSARILRQREFLEFTAGHELNDLFIEHPSNGILAKQVFYTYPKSPEETADAIISQLDLSKRDSVILIGPMCAGKSTLGVILARKLGLNQISLDMIRGEYYKEIGYDYAAAIEVHKQSGLMGLFQYRQLYNAHAAKRVIEDYPASVIDFGAGHSVFTDPDLFEQVKETLAPYQNVILLLPSPDIAETKKILRQRGESLLTSIFDLHEDFTRSGSFEKIAKQIVYTEDKTPEQVAAEVLNLPPTF